MMKHVLFVLIFISIAVCSYARTTPEAYLSQIPAAPQNCCDKDNRQKAPYSKKIDDLHDNMKQEIRERNKDAQAFMDKNGQELGSKTTLPDEVKKKGKQKMSKEEKEAMKARMMQEYGISPDDVKRAKNMSKEERLAFGNSIATNADKKLKNDPKYQKTIKGGKEKMEMGQEMEPLRKKINARIDEMEKKFNDLDKEAEGLKKTEFEPIEKKIKGLNMSFGVATKADVEKKPLYDQYMKELEAAKKRFCEKMSTRYRALLDEYRSVMKVCIPDTRKYEALNAKVNFDLDKPIEPQDGLMGIELIYKKLIPRFDDTFKYNLLD